MNIQRNQLVLVNTEERLNPIQLAVTCSATTAGRAMRAPEVSIKWMKADGAAYVAGRTETIEVATILRIFPRDTWHLATHRGTRRYTLTDEAVNIYKECRSLTTTALEVETANTKLRHLRDTVLQQANSPVAFPEQVFYGNCPICLDEPETPVILTCGHRYCVNCLMANLRSEVALNERNGTLKEHACGCCMRPIHVAELLAMYCNARPRPVTVQVFLSPPFCSGQYARCIISTCLTI